jgi:hypothetical protein
MAELAQKCRIWETPSQVYGSEGRTWYINSPRAGGEYKLTDEAEGELISCQPAAKARLTTWMIDERRLGNAIPLVTSERVDDAKRRKALSVPSRAIRLLSHLAEQTAYVGANVLAVNSFRNDDQYDKRPTSSSDLGVRRDQLLAATESLTSGEIVFLRNYLVAQSWLGLTQQRDGHQVTVEGFAKLDELASVKVNSDQAFVAMWFDASMDAVWRHGIEPACQDAGYRAFRIDKKDHNNKIDDEIIAEIRRSRFLVADFTHGDAGQRGGVYYEAGFAHGLAIPAIFTCRMDCLDRVHFDTRQYNHIVWSTPEGLRLLLAQRISATLGDGPRRPSGV